MIEFAKELFEASTYLLMCVAQLCVIGFLLSGVFHAGCWAVDEYRNLGDSKQFRKEQIEALKARKKYWQKNGGEER